MKLFSINRITFAALFVLVSALYSCQKESSSTTNEPEVSEEQAVAHAEESTDAEASFDDIEDISMQAADEESVVSAPNGRFSLFSIFVLGSGLAL